MINVAVHLGLVILQTHKFCTAPLLQFCSCTMEKKVLVYGRFAIIRWEGLRFIFEQKVKRK